MKDDQRNAGQASAGSARQNQHLQRVEVIERFQSLAQSMIVENGNPFQLRFLTCRLQSRNGRVVGSQLTSK